MKLYVIDRFEGVLAVVEDSLGNMQNVCRDKLPQNAREGDVIVEENGVYTVDADKTHLRAEKIGKLIQGLFSDD